MNGQALSNYDPDEPDKPLSQVYFRASENAVTEQKAGALPKLQAILRSFNQEQILLFKTIVETVQLGLTCVTKQLLPSEFLSFLVCMI